jgi:signal peptidase I
MKDKQRFVLKEVALASLACAEFALVATVVLLGISFIPVLSGSMGDTLPVGSVAIASQLDTGLISPGDVVVLPIPEQSPSHYVHRVVSTDITTNGIALRTKGDKNPAVDPWTAVVVSPSTPHVIGYVPLLGYLHNWTTAMWVRFALLGSVLTLILLVMYRLVSNRLPRRKSTLISQPPSDNTTLSSGEVVTVSQEQKLFLL